MTVKELKEVLAGHPDEMTVFFSLWTEHGERRYHLNRPMQNPVEEIVGEEFLRISWTDDCTAEMIFQ